MEIICYNVGKGDEEMLILTLCLALVALIVLGFVLAVWGIEMMIDLEDDNETSLD